MGFNLKNKFREGAGQTLINWLTAGKLNNKQTATIFEFARRKDELGRFLSYSLILNESKVKDENLKKNIQDLKKNVFPESFDYDHFYEDGKLVFRLYFLSNEFYDSETRGVDPAKNQIGTWKHWLTQNFGEGEKITLLDKEYTRFKKVEKLKDGRQITVYIDVSYVAERDTDFKGRTFELIGHPETDFVGYFGHTGGGVNLALSFETAPTDEFAVSNPVGVILSDCSSGPTYENKLYQLYPNAQTIVTKQTTHEPDSPRIFNEMYQGMLNLETHRKLNKRLEKFDWKEERVSKSYTFPDDSEKLSWRDSDRDGLSDSDDPVYNFIDRDKTVTFDDFEFRQTSEDPKQSLFELTNYLKYRFGPNSFLKYFTDISFPQESEDGFNIKGWYRSLIGKDLLKINEKSTESGVDIPSFEIKFNVGYSHTSLRPLKMATIYELVDYFTRNYEVKGDKPIKRDSPLKKMTPAQNFWAFIKAVEVLSLELHAAGGEEKRSHLESIYNKFVEKYNLPKEINFDIADKAYWSKPIAGTIRTSETDEALEKVQKAFGVDGALKLVSFNQHIIDPVNNTEFWIADVSSENSNIVNMADQVGGFENIQLATNTPLEEIVEQDNNLPSNDLAMTEIVEPDRMVDTPHLSSRQGLQLKDSEIHITKPDASSGDSAMLADRASIEENPGGIDLNPTNLNLQIKGEGMGFNLFYDCPAGTVQFNADKCTPRNSEQLQNLPIPGLYPVILNVVPMTNLPFILGISEEDTGEENNPAVSFQKKPAIRESGYALATIP